MLAKANEANGESVDHERLNLGCSVMMNSPHFEALLAKVASRPACKPKLLVPDTLAPIAKG